VWPRRVFRSVALPSRVSITRPGALPFHVLHRCDLLGTALNVAPGHSPGWLRSLMPGLLCKRHSNRSDKAAVPSLRSCALAGLYSAVSRCSLVLLARRHTSGNERRATVFAPRTRVVAFF
jgi:hypothetical protein